jgi:hypothetical protein
MFRQRPKPAFLAAAWPSAREIASRLKGETHPDGSGNYACHCPGPLHRNGDINPSLSVKDGKNGRPLLHCHAGCGFRDIVAALEHMGILPRRER